MEEGTARAADGDGFVRVRGNQLVLGDAPFRFAGANLAVMHHPENRDAAEALIAEAARDGIRVGRIWALGEGAADAARWQRDGFLFRAGPDGWIDAATDHLDRVIAASGRAGLRLIITLSNSWPDYGGVPQYLRWSNRWRDDVYGSGDRFYGDAASRAAFRAHVERLLTRTNGVTGLAYRDDPTILAWELMNESQVATSAGAAARRAWIGDMARLVHRLDPNHLVTPGVSLYRLERERKEWLAVCRLPEVDYCDGHIYPEEALAGRDVAAALDAALDDFVQLAQHVAGKPFVLGEFGVHGDAVGLWQEQTRATWTARIFDRLRFDGAAGGLIWIYQPGGGPGDDSRPPGHDVRVGDPRAAPIRQAMQAAALHMAAPPAAELNPLLGPDKGEAELLPLHAVLDGAVAVIPAASPSPSRARAGARVVRLTWDPVAFTRASWETTGAYAGGAVEHVWGAESGWYEYGYDVPAEAAGAMRAARRLTLRARVSSEYPGTLSPPDGASKIEVLIDGRRVASAIAARDDGQGRWIALRSTDPALLRAAARVGRHLVRFAVPAGPRAHGLCIYGKPGAKPVQGISTGPIELALEEGPAAPAR